LKKSDIYKFLTGEKDTVPEFCSNWLTFSATPKVTTDTDKIAARLTPVPQHRQLQAAVRGYSASAPTSPSRKLHDQKTKVDYRALHLGQTIKQDIQHPAQEVKQKCKQMRKSVRKSEKATVTKLAPGAFSPKQQTPCFCTCLSAFFFFFFFLDILALKINGAQAVPDLQPKLLDSNYVEPSKLQLLFRPSRKYAASTHFIHIRVPFNFSQLTLTLTLIFNQYHR
jgi:hypothetical protein